MSDYLRISEENKRLTEQNAALTAENDQLRAELEKISGAKTVSKAHSLAEAALKAE